jgi:hypothetical protein
VKCFVPAGATKQSAAPTKPFLVPHENKQKPTQGDNPSVQTMGTVMLAFIFNLIYREYCKKSLTDIRRHKWNVATAG